MIWFSPELAWMKDAACQVPTASPQRKRTLGDRFFTPRGQVDPSVLRACKTCPVQQACLEWAIENDEEGVWAGTTRPQRRRMAVAS